MIALDPCISCSSLSAAGDQAQRACSLLAALGALDSSAIWTGEAHDKQTLHSCELPPQLSMVDGADDRRWLSAADGCSMWCRGGQAHSSQPSLPGDRRAERWRGRHPRCKQHECTQSWAKRGRACGNRTCSAQGHANQRASDNQHGRSDACWRGGNRRCKSSRSRERRVCRGQRRKRDPHDEWRLLRHSH